MFRMDLWCLFRHFYSAKRSADFPTRESVFVAAIQATRDYFPDFWPEVA